MENTLDVELAKITDNLVVEVIDNTKKIDELEAILGNGLTRLEQAEKISELRKEIEESFYKQKEHYNKIISMDMAGFRELWLNLLQVLENQIEYNKSRFNKINGVDEK